MKVLIAGDFVPRYRTATQIESGDYSCLSEVEPIIQAADYAIVNFESPVVIHEAEPIDKTGPNLKCSERAMECVAQAGFKCVTLANNHFRDYGQVGVEDTLSACNKYGLDYVGGGNNFVEAQKIFYKEINKHRLAIVNSCENEWSIAGVDYGGSNPLDIVAVSRAIKLAHENADYVLVIIHGGTELYNLPTPRMKNIYRFFVEQGADAVVNHHQHCYSGYEIYQGKPIFYGLGNFCFESIANHSDKLWEEGFLLELFFGTVISFKLYPYIQCNVKSASVQMISNTEDFNESIRKLNMIINNDAQLQYCFEKMAKKGERIVRNLLIPYSSLFSKRLQKLHLLPSFVNKDRIKLFLAHIQCETHRDVVLFGLRKLFNRN